MTLQGTHDFGEIENTRVTFVEKGATEDRMKFLRKLLEHNAFTVLVEKIKSDVETEPETYTIGVDNILFNPTIYVYERRLKTLDNRLVSPVYWEQQTEETKPQYWDEMYRK